MNVRKIMLKYAGLLTVAPSLVVFVVLTALTWQSPEKAMYNGPIAMVLMLLTSFGLKKYNTYYMKKAQSSLYEECDPYPMMSEIKLYLECVGRRVNKSGMTLTYGMMQALTGEYRDAEATIKSIDVGESSTLPAGAKAGVLYDLAALYCMMNLRALAVEYYDRAKALFNTAPDRIRYKMDFSGPTDGEIEFYKGNTDAALGILEAIRPDNRFHETTKRFALAKVHYMLGNKDRALEEFRWVADNGGRLARAKESRDIVEYAERA